MQGKVELLHGLHRGWEPTPYGTAVGHLHHDCLPAGKACPLLTSKLRAWSCTPPNTLFPPLSNPGCRLPRWDRGSQSKECRIRPPVINFLPWFWHTGLLEMVCSFCCCCSWHLTLELSLSFGYWQQQVAGVGWGEWERRELPVNTAGKRGGLKKGEGDS